MEPHPPATPTISDPSPTDFDWSVGNDFLVSASSDGTTCLWDPVSGTCLRQLSEGGGERVLCCRFHPNNNNLVVVSCTVSGWGVLCVYITAWGVLYELYYCMGCPVCVYYSMGCSVCIYYCMGYAIYVYMLEDGLVLCVYDTASKGVPSYLQHYIRCSLKIVSV